MQTWSSAWGEQPIEHADEVTLSRKGTKRRTRIAGLRPTRTKARARVGRIREPRAELEKKLDARTQELAEARKQQTATSEVLKVISRSPNQLQPVLDSIVATAADLCQADFAMIHILEHGRFRLVAANNVEAASAASVAPSVRLLFQRRLELSESLRVRRRSM
jgi:hypothetical protein